LPERSRVEAFIAAVESGDHVRAIADFYHADASMQENAGPLRSGREVLIEHEARALQQLRRMDTHPVETWLLDGDRVVIHWTFDATDAKGVTRRLEELALQRWRGDRIESERFFYDAAAAWRVVESSAEARPRSHSASQSGIQVSDQSACSPGSSERGTTAT